MLREILARFGIQVDSKPLTKANTMIGGAIGQLRALGGVLAGAFLVRAISGFVSEMITLGDTVAKTAKQIGVSTDDLQAWEFAAERSGASAGSLVKGLRRLQKNVVDAGAGLTTAVRAFDRLGIAFRDADGNSRQIADILPELADRFANMESATERSATAQELFGRAGNELLPLLTAGSAGLQELRERFEELGGGLSTEFLGNAEAAQDAITDFDLASRGLKSTIAVEVLPTFTRWAVKMADIVAWLRTATEGTSVWKVALIGLASVAGVVAVAMIAAFAKPIAVVLLAAAAITGVILVIDDLVNFIQGNQSVFGQFLEAMGRNSNAARLELISFAAVFVEFWGTTFPSLVTAAWADFGNALEAAILDFNQWNQASVRFRQWMTEAIDAVVAAWKRLVDTISDPVQASGAIGSVIEGAFNFVTGGGGSAPAAAPALPAGAGGGATVENTNNISIDARGAQNPEDIRRAARQAVDDANTNMLRNAQRALNPLAE